MNGAEALVHTLVDNGVDVYFANPGTSEMHFVAALDRIAGMRCVLGLFEGVVTGAADGYYRMADKPAATLLLADQFGRSVVRASSKCNSEREVSAACARLGLPIGPDQHQEPSGARPVPNDGSARSEAGPTARILRLNRHARPGSEVLARSITRSVPRTGS